MTHFYRPNTIKKDIFLLELEMRAHQSIANSKWRSKVTKSKLNLYYICPNFTQYSG